MPVPNTIAVLWLKPAGRVGIIVEIPVAMVLSANRFVRAVMKFEAGDRMYEFPALSKKVQGLSESRSIKSGGANSPLYVTCESPAGYPENSGNGDVFADSLFHVTENRTVAWLWYVRIKAVRELDPR